METEKEQWIEGVFSSMEGASRAIPRSGLLDEIESELDALDQDSTSIRILGGLQRKIAVAAAVLLIVGNVFAISSMSQSEGQDQTSTEELADQSLISGYNLYN